MPDSPPGIALASMRDVAERDLARVRADFGMLAVLHEAQVQFEGSAAELRASRNAYLMEFLFLTLPRW